MTGGSQFDVFYEGPGNDGLQGGDGIDLLRYPKKGKGITVDLAQETASGYGSDTVVDIESVSGTHSSDVLIGDSAQNFLLGGPARDVIKGGRGLDRIEGGFGRDRLRGGGGRRDEVHYPFAIDDGRGDFWRVSLRAGKATGDAGTDSLRGFERIIGGSVLIGDSGPNLLDGGAKGDVIRGLKGDDRIKPGGGADRAFGGKGDDTIGGKHGYGSDLLLAGDGRDLVLETGVRVDRIFGGAGRDRLSYLFAPGGVNVDLAKGAARVCPPQCSNSILRGFENLTGSRFGEDILKGNGASNSIVGLARDDDLRGRGGPDFLDGSNGSDRLDGGPGRDNCTNGEAVSGCEP
jgi:Ca2+-binding RTX toxin-like protein